MALMAGCTYPVFILKWGEVLDIFADNYHRIAMVLPTMEDYLYTFIKIGAASFVVNSLLFSIWRIISESIAERCRIRYMEQFIKKDVSWLESQNLIELSTKFKENCLSLQKSIGDKIALYSSMVGMLGSCILTSLFIRWTYSLYLLAILPFSAAILNNFLDKLIKKKEN